MYKIILPCIILISLSACNSKVHETTNLGLASTINKKNKDTLYGIIVDEENDKTYPESIINRITKIKQPKAEDYYLLSQAYFVKGEYEKADIAINKALSVSPNNIHFVHQRGLLYFAQGKYNKAEEDFLACYKHDLYDGVKSLQKQLWELRSKFLGKDKFIKKDLTQKQLVAAETFKKKKYDDREKYTYVFFNIFPACYPTKSSIQISDYKNPYFNMSEQDVKELIGLPDYLRYDYSKAGIDKKQFEYVYKLNNKKNENFVITFYNGNVVSFGIE
jgi:tetratricopeptide (TPR) repeat protein